MGGNHGRISWESITRKLIFVDRSNKKNEKQLETQDEDKLKQTFSDNGFFEVKNFYPNRENIPDSFEHTHTHCHNRWPNTSDPLD
jgi:endonuclease III-like uncharacterized protein